MRLNCAPLLLGWVCDAVRCEVIYIGSLVFVWVQLNLVKFKSYFIILSQSPVFSCTVIYSPFPGSYESVLSYYICHTCVECIFISRSTLKVGKEHVICKAHSSIKTGLR